MSVRQSSLKSVFLLSVCSFGHLVLQFVLLKILAEFFGAGADFDAYSAARAAPLVLSTILVGSLNFAFVPVFIERCETLGEQAAWRTAGAVGGMLLLVTFALALIGFLAAVPIVSLLNPGFSTEQLQLTAQLFRILIWLIVTNGAISFLQAVHHCQGRFFMPAATPPLGGAVAIVITLLFHQSWGISAVAIGVISGATLAALLQLPLFLRHARFQWVLDEGLSRMLRLIAPLAAGAAYYKLDPLVDRYLSSRMPTGSVSLLEYSWQFTSAMLILTSSGLSVVVFPVISQRAAEGDREGLKQELSYAMRFLAFVLTPTVVGLALFSTPVIADLLQGGAFQSADSEAVSRLIKIYTMVIVGGSFGEMLSRVFYALKDTWTPVIISIVGFTLGALAKITVGARGGVDGIAAATAAYYLFNAACMLLILRRLIEGIGFAGVLRTVRDCLVGTAATCVVAYALLQLDFRFRSIPAAALSAVTYAGVMYGLRNEFATTFFSFLNRQWRRLTSKGDYGPAD